MNKVELKLCPCCGGEAKIITHSFYARDDYQEDTYGVRCTYCGLQTNQFYVTKDRAAESWNRRVNEE